MDLPSDIDPEALRPLKERLAASQHAEWGADDDPPAGVHPKAKEFARYWQSIRPGPGLLPGRQHIDPLSIPKLLSNIWILEVVPDDPRRVRVRLVGTAIERAGAQLRKGSFIADHGTREEGAAAAAMFCELTQTKRLNWRRGPSALGYFQYVRELERVILPLASDGATVDGFLNLSVFYFSNGTEL